MGHQLLPRHLKVVTWVRLHRYFYFRYPASVDCVRVTLTIPRHVCRSFCRYVRKSFRCICIWSHVTLSPAISRCRIIFTIYIYIYIFKHTHIDMDIYIHTHIYTHTYQGLIPLRWASTLETGSHSLALFLRVFSLETQKIDLAILKDI